MAITASPRHADTHDTAGEMMAAVLPGPPDPRVEQAPGPRPPAGEGTVAGSAGGSAVHYLEQGRIGDFVVTQPLVLGHETAGVVVAVGPGVSAARIGERVSLEPGASCGRCLECRSGRYNLCAQMRFHGTPPV